MKIAKIILVSKIILQALLTTFALSILLSIGQMRLAHILQGISPIEHPWIVVGDLFSQILIFAILSLPIVLILYLLIRLFHYYRKIEPRFALYVMTSALVITLVFAISYSPFAQEYILMTVGGMQLLSQKFYPIAIIYLLLSIIYKRWR